MAEITKVSVTYRRSMPAGPTPNCMTLECSAEATLAPGDDPAIVREGLFGYCQEGVRVAHETLLAKKAQA